MVETGWRAVLNEPVEEKEEDMTLLPDIVQGDELPVKGCGTEQKQTRPRPLHTESSLLAAMETAGRELSDEAEREAMKDAGIGTPATRAAIIETLFAREYVRREKKSLVPTDKGLAVYGRGQGQEDCRCRHDGRLGTGLSKIATGEMDAPTFHRGIEVFASQIAKELLEARIDGAESDTACPRCGRPVVFYPKLAKCQNPDCGLTVWRTVGRKELTDKQLAEPADQRQNRHDPGDSSKTAAERSTRPSRSMTSSRPRSFSNRAILPGRERGTNGNNRYLCHWKRPVITRYACLIRIFQWSALRVGTRGAFLFPDYQRPLKNSYHARQATPYPPRGELSYYGLSLLSYLKDSHPELIAESEFIAERADSAAQAYSEAIRSGCNHIEAEEIAREELYRGLHFSPYNTLVNILWREFEAEIPEDTARQAALRLLPLCRGVLEKYDLTDDFADTPDYELFYTELTGTVQILLEDGIQ